MSTLSLERCVRHASREAAAKCTRCGRYFCRECVTEYEDRLTCALCLRKTGSAPQKKSGIFQGVWLTVKAVCAFLWIWTVFYYLGQGLASLPSDFHGNILGNFR